MKNILPLIFIAFLIFSCKSQTPVVGLNESRFQTSDGAYFKDTQNDLGRLVGTWKHTSNNQTFTFQLLKKEMYFDDKDYEDLLIGEYSYSENGSEFINTLSLLNDSNIDPYNNNIIGNQIVSNNRYTTCYNCDENTRRIGLSISDPERPYLRAHMLVIRYINENEIKVTVVPTHGVLIPYEGAPTTLRVPNGDYLMIKQ